MRQTWAQTWGQLALAMAQRSRCDRAKIGAVIVSAKNFVVASGYNGPPADWKYASTDHCEDWCRVGAGKSPPGTYTDCPSNHAEINALMHSSRIDREGGSIYVTGSVCYICAKAIANSGLESVMLVNVDEEADAHRNPEKTRALLEDSGLRVFDVVVAG